MFRYAKIKFVYTECRYNDIIFAYLTMIILLHLPIYYYINGQANNRSSATVHVLLSRGNNANDRNMRDWKVYVYEKLQSRRAVYCANDKN